MDSLQKKAVKYALLAIKNDVETILTYEVDYDQIEILLSALNTTARRCLYVYYLYRKNCGVSMISVVTKIDSKTVQEIVDMIEKESL